MKTISKHCIKSARIWSYSGLYLPAFGLNTDQINSEYGTFYVEKSTKKFNINKTRKLKIIWNITPTIDHYPRNQWKEDTDPQLICHVNLGNE